MDERARLAIEAVRRYAAALKRIRGRLFTDYPQFNSVLDLMVAVRSARTMPCEGRSSSGIEYSVHGFGCRMTDERGREVDVDLVGDDVEAFDGWRIRMFLYEEGVGDLSVDDLLDACSYLASCGELEEVQAGRWYALPSRG